MGDEVKINYTEANVNPDNLSGVLISEDAAESLVRCFLPNPYPILQTLFCLAHFQRRTLYREENI